ncbi:hypothetical protein KI387_002473, partial [Taxus chinensis]
MILGPMGHKLVRVAGAERSTLHKCVPRNEAEYGFWIHSSNDASLSRKSAANR